MVKISGGQLFAILLIVSSFGMICSQSAYSAGQMTGIFISAVIQAFLIFPVLYLNKRRNFSIQTIPKWVLWLYTAYFLLYGGYAFSEFSAVSEEMRFPVRWKILALLLAAAVCLYSSMLGLKSVARVSVIISALFIVSVIILFAGAYSKFDMSNFAWQKPYGILQSGISDFIYSSELAVIFILFGNTEKNHAKSAYGFIGAKLIIAEIISFTGTAVLGSLSGMFDFPFFTLGSISQPFAVQRADGLYIILLAILCTVSITIYITIASMLIRTLLPNFKYNEIAAVVVMLLLSFLFSCMPDIESVIWTVLTGILYIAVPFIMIGSDGNDEKSHG